jgi:DEAD/DEAH box helicase domain-containing protein
VWSLSYHDVQAVFEKREDDIPDFIENNWSATKETLWERAGLTPAQRMENRSSFRMLFAFLCQAKADIWRRIAETYALCSIRSPIDAEERAGKCLALAELFPENLVHCAVLEDAGYFGEYPGSFSRRVFSAQRDPQAYSAALFLDDAADNRESEAFVREWVGFLRAFNLFQFISNSAAISRSGVADGLYQDIHPVQERQEMKHASAAQQAAWEELKELVSDAFLPLLERLLNENAIAPTVGFELEQNGQYLGQIELAWPQHKIGILEQGELHMQKGLKTHGWELFSLQTATGHIERILDTLKQGATHGY